LHARIKATRRTWALATTAALLLVAKTQLGHGLRSAHPPLLQNAKYCLGA
jgi:hypothetical protein